MPQALPFNMNGVAQAVDRLPNLYNRIGEAVGFTRMPQAETTVTIIRRDGQLVLLDPLSRDADRQELGAESEDFVSFVVPSRKIGTRLTPSDIQNVTAFAPGPRQLEQQADAYNRRLMRVRRPHDITFEHIRLAAIKGLITKPNGDVMYNLFDVFGVTKKVVQADLTDAGFHILDLTEEINDHIAENLRGETSTGVHVMTDSASLKALRKHESFEQYLKGHAAALDQLAASRDSASNANARRQVLADGVTFESYSGKAPNSAGSVVDFIAANRGHAFPTGTTQTFIDVDVPANRMGETNTPPSEEIKIYPKDLDQGKGIDLDTESNKIALCTRPEVLVEVQFTLPA